MTIKLQDTTVDRVLPVLRSLDHRAVLGIAAFGMLILLVATDGLFLEHLVHRYAPYQHDMIKLRLVILIAAGTLGLGIGWWMSGRNPLVRNVLKGLLAGILGFLVLYDQGFLGWGSLTIAAFLAFVSGVGYLMRGFWDRLAETPTTFGTASWAGLAELERADLFDDAGFRLGTVSTDHGNREFFYNGNRHMLTIAPTTWGKGTTMVVPNLLTYDGSVMVIDPKGENSMTTAERRKAMGQQVFIVDPWDITGMETARINPMDWLVQGDVDLGDNAKILADAIIMNMGENEQFWTEEAKALLLGVIYFVATDKEEEGQRHLGRVRDLLMYDGEALTKLFKRMLKSPHHIVRSTGARCLQKEEKLLSNVLASVQAQTHFLDSQRIRDSLSVSDFDFADLKTTPMSIFLVLPSDRLDEYGRWLRLLIQQALTVNARNIEKKPKKSVLFILDEMPALGKLSKVEQAFGLMAGYGMQIHGICQDFSQLRRIYGDGCENFHLQCRDDPVFWITRCNDCRVFLKALRRDHRVGSVNGDIPCSGCVARERNIKFHNRHNQRDGCG